MMALILYHVPWCPECAVVRDKLTALNLTYDDVLVPDFRPARQQVFEVSGQYYVPVLKDGETVLTETRDIVAHLDEHYGKGKGQAASGEGKGRAQDEGGERQWATGERQDRAQDASGDGEDDAPCCSL
jgi:glutathione S-transferase